MKRASFGVQMHSGWGVLVAVSGDAHAVEILDRRRIVIADPSTPGAVQPYHFAVGLAPSQQKEHLAHCAEASSRLAAKAIAGVIGELDGRRYRIVGAAVLLASGRTLPSLEKILSAHPLIHTAEGEFFRHAASQACEDLQIPVTAIRVRELDERANAAFGNAARRVENNVAKLGSSIGPPWTKDHKTAALAALLVLAPKR
jgi:hypothetical protein